jgi:hypothetical protein
VGRQLHEGGPSAWLGQPRDDTRPNHQGYIHRNLCRIELPRSEQNGNHDNFRSKYIWPKYLHRFVLEGTIPTMKKLTNLIPLLAVAALLLTSCTTVVEKPAPTTTTTTTHTETVKRVPAPAPVEQTTTRSGY